VQLLFGRNGGMIASFQRAMPLVDADVTCFLDADDYWESEYQQRIGQVYDSQPEIDAVFSDLQNFGHDDEKLSFHSREIDLGFTAMMAFLTPFSYGSYTSAMTLRSNYARAVLQVPDSIRDQYTHAGDSFLDIGSSILGARKYFQPTDCVKRCIHDDNYSHVSDGPIRAYRYPLLYRILRAHYGRLAGLEIPFLDAKICKREFLTKPAPPWWETKLYARMVAGLSTEPWWKRYRYAWSILRHGWKSRRA